MQACDCQISSEWGCLFWTMNCLKKYHFEMNNFFLSMFVLKDSGIELSQKMLEAHVEIVLMLLLFFI